MSRSPGTFGGSERQGREGTPPALLRGRGRIDRGQQLRQHQFHSAQIREITPPRFDASGEHGTVSLVSDLLDVHGQTIGRWRCWPISISSSGMWWNRAGGRAARPFSWMNAGRSWSARCPADTATSTVPRCAGRGDLQGHGPGSRWHGAGARPPPGLRSAGIYRLEEAPWVLVMIAPGREILSPIIQFR